MLDSDQYASGDKFFTEADLIETFDISRNTAKQVLSRLADEGYIIRERGKRTYVSKPRLQQSLEKISSFSYVAVAAQRRGTCTAFIGNKIE